MGKFNDYVTAENTALLVFSSVSFGTTYYGLSTIATSDTSLATVLTALIVLLLQGALVFFLLTMMRFRGGTRIVSAFMYVVLMNVSVYFSYNAYYDVFQSENYERKTVKSSVDSLRNQSQSVVDSVQEMGVRLVELSEYSSRTAIVEKESGRTCDPEVPSGEGPRRYLRDQEAIEFKELNEDFNRLASDVTDYQVELSGILDDYNLEGESTDIAGIELEINRIANRLNAIISTDFEEGSTVSRLRTILQRLEKSKSSARSSMESYDTRSNQYVNVSCPDTRIGLAVDNILTSSFPKIASFSLFDSSDDREVMDRSRRVYLSMFGITEESAEQSKDFDLSDYFPLVAGFAVDIFLLLTPIFSNLYKRNPPITRDDAEKAAKFLTGKAKLDTPYVFMSSIMFKSRSGSYLVVPSLGSYVDEKEKKISYGRDLASLIEIWAARNYVSIYVRHVKGKKLPLSYFSIYDYEGAANDRFDVYKINASVWNEYLLSMYEEGNDEIKDT